MLRILVTIKFISGKFEGIILNNCHLFDIPTTMRTDTVNWLSDCVAYDVKLFDMTNNRYQIIDYHLEEIKDAK